MAFWAPGGFQEGKFAFGLYGIDSPRLVCWQPLVLLWLQTPLAQLLTNAGETHKWLTCPKKRQRTDALDSLGNTTAATGKGFAIGSAALTALALFGYIEEVRIWISRGIEACRWNVCQRSHHFVKGATDRSQGIINISEAQMSDFMAAYDVSLMNPAVISGLFLGSMMVFLFAALTIKAVGRAAGSMVEEVRRQFKEMPGIMDGSQKPDYARCVLISTRGAQREMIVPAMLAIVTPIATGLVFGVTGVMGLLIGGLSTGFVTAIMLNNAGGAWDNAKKFIESGQYGGKGSGRPQGRLVGTWATLQDTTGPSLNILIKLMSMVSVVFAGLIVAAGGLF